MRKKLSLFLFLFLIPTFVYAWGAMILSGGVPSGVCSTPDNGDEMDEGFIGAGYELGAAWSETVGAGDIVDEDANLPGSPPVNNCSEGLRVDSNETLSYSSWNRGSTFDRSGNLDVVVELYVTSVTIGNYTASDTITWGPASGSVAVSQLYNDGGTLKIRGTGSSNSTAVTFTTGAWHIIKLHMDGTAASSYIQLDGGAQNTFTRNDIADGQYLKLGSIWGIGAGEEVDIYFGYVYINSP